MGWARVLPREVLHQVLPISSEPPQEPLQVESVWSLQLRVVKSPPKVTQLGSAQPGVPSQETTSFVLSPPAAAPSAPQALVWKQPGVKSPSTLQGALERTGRQG